MNLTRVQNPRKVLVLEPAMSDKREALQNTPDSDYIFDDMLMQLDGINISKTRTLVAADFIALQIRKAGRDAAYWKVPIWRDILEVLLPPMAAVKEVKQISLKF